VLCLLAKLLFLASRWLSRRRKKSFFSPNNIVKQILWCWKSIHMITHSFSLYYHSHRAFTPDIPEHRQLRTREALEKLSFIPRSVEAREESSCANIIDFFPVQPKEAFSCLCSRVALREKVRMCVRSRVLNARSFFFAFRLLVCKPKGVNGNFHFKRRKSAIY